MNSHWKAAALAAALLFGGCSGGTRSASVPADAWMDGAAVVVAQDASTGRETVTLVDRELGVEQIVDDEPLAP